MDQVERFTEPFVGSSKDEDETSDQHLATALQSVDFKRSVSNINDELWQFRVGLMWLGLQQLSATHLVFSWILFLAFSILIPLCSIWMVVCHDCKKSEKHPFKALVQISESGLSVIGFLCLSGFLRTYGLRKMLFLDQIGKESAQVQHGYQDQLQDSFRLLLKVLLPCFMVELIHKIMWFTRASVQIPLISNELAKKVIMCFLMMVSWLYRAAVFLLMCVLFRLICTLQILRFKGFYKLLESSYAQTTHCSLILKEHMRIRDQLIIMSHRFRIFLLSSLITITLSQIVSLFIITARPGAVTFPEIGDLAVCSATQLIGFVLCLHGAAKITHTAHRIVSFVSRWHAVSCCMESSSNNSIEGSPILHVESHEDLEAACNSVSVAGEVPRTAIKYNPRTYFKRQALVSYFQHCKGSITIYGFAVDRGSIYGIFVLELSLLLWTLGKTIGVGPQ
ncbi:hypothetical protein SUGI_0166870 [Cryptomeria japonica]|uniref:uncharacterized protein LOC131031578 n=1 Tax=Cryptomeria japonica TaxID=3369 RepID=UPI0024089485|nr:uncharacterized protein LOC131031578 [Cryptomeria japonica]GLJ11417.1 hypothetical protein SUGI_0166870 [Cryptomeria japonica]